MLKCKIYYKMEICLFHLIKFEFQISFRMSVVEQLVGKNYLFYLFQINMQRSTSLINPKTSTTDFQQIVIR